MKKTNIGRVIGKIFLILLAAVCVFLAGVFVYHRIQTAKETSLLKEKGYYNPVSVGEYSLNAAIFGNENGRHTIVCLAGLGMGDFSASARQMTAPLEKDNTVVFIDRAGYGFSDDTDNEMTLSYIVEDYRRALQGAGLEAPYVLLAHSIGGAYATYWVSTYPDEIEAVIFADGSQLSENAFEGEEEYSVGITDRLLAFGAKIGLSRFVLRDYCYHYPDNYSEEEQYLGDALSLMTLDSIAPVSESGLLCRNGREAFDGIITNDVPKLYICASWGFENAEEVIESNRWINRQIEINNLDLPPFSEDIDEKMSDLLEEYEKARNDIIYPYAEKMGNCRVVCLGGDHMIYEQKPAECSEIIIDFMETELGKH